MEEASEVSGVVPVEEVKDKEDNSNPKPKVDVYNLPELNLSESDSSDSEAEADGKTEGCGDSEQVVEKDEEKSDAGIIENSNNGKSITCSNKLIY